MITYKQLSLADIFTDCSHSHAATSRPRKHLLYPMLKALLLQFIFSIPRHLS